MLAKLRGRTTALIRIETGRWNGLKREERSCRQCTVEEEEDEEHFLLRCEGWGQERKMLAGFMDDLIEEVCTATDDRKVALIPDQACSSREDMHGSADSCRVPNLYGFACVPCVTFVPDPHNGLPLIALQFTLLYLMSLQYLISV